jgi:acyl-CoA hydrolase
MAITSLITYHLVKSEDLNHHGTLFAGRNAEWFVEAGFIAAAALTRPENIVCLKIHGMGFHRPVHRGEVIRFESKIVFAGRTRLVAHISMKGKEEQDQIVEGFITFIHVDQEGRPIPHGIQLSPETEEELQLQETAQNLR